MSAREFRRCIAALGYAAAVVGLLSACGSSATSSAPLSGSTGGGTSTNQAVTGVATPSSVSVVTAN